MIMKQLVCLILMVHIIFASANDNLRFFKKLGEYEHTDGLMQHSINSTYYATHELKLNWTDAFVFCRSFGMELLMMETEDEYNFVVNMLMKKYNLSEGQYVHIGGTREGSKDWYWAATGRTIDYTIKWAPYQPDNNWGSIESCMSLLKSSTTFEFNDVSPNTEPQKFVCEKTEHVKENY